MRKSSLRWVDATHITWKSILVCILSLSKSGMSSKDQQPSPFVVIMDMENFYHDSPYFLPDKIWAGSEVLTQVFRNKLLATPLLFGERKCIILPFLIHSGGEKPHLFGFDFLNNLGCLGRKFL